MTGSAVTTLKVDGLKVDGLTDDGNGARLSFEVPDGQVALSFGEQQLGELFTAVCAALDLLKQQRGRQDILVFEPEGWDLGRLASGRLAVRFHLRGTELTFAIPMSQVAPALRFLQDLQDHAIAAAKRRH